MNKEIKVEKSEPQLRLVSDGTSFGTKLYYGDTWVRGVCSVNIKEISHSSPIVSAEITFEKLSLDIILKDADIVTVDPLTDSQIKKALFVENNA